MHDPDANVTMRYASDLHMCNFINVDERHCRVAYVRWNRPATVPIIFEILGDQGQRQPKAASVHFEWARV